MFKTILLAYDGSDHAQNALKAVATMVEKGASHLHLVHIPQMDTPPIVIGSFVSQIGTPPTQDEIAQAGQFVAEQATSEAKALGLEITEVHLGKGLPANVILSTANKIDADLIVMGRRGLGAIGAFALGSVSQAVAHEAQCACLTVV